MTFVLECVSKRELRKFEWIFLFETHSNGLILDMLKK